jgi:AdoMet-dependent heme synthase
MYIEQERHEDFCNVKSSGNGELIFSSKDNQPLSEYPNELLTRALPLKAPFVVHLELTRRCGLNCKHCYISAGKARKDELTTMEWKVILSQLKELEVLGVYFTGGDPLLHKGCLELLAYAKELGLSCNLLTNGIELENNIDIKSIPKEIFLVLSFDGTKGTSALRHISGERIMRVVNTLRKNNRAFAIQGVVFNNNVSEMIQTMKWSQQNGIDFCTNSIYPIGRAKKNKNLLLGKKHFSALLKLEKASKEYQEQVVLSRPSYPFANPDIYQSIAKLVKATKRPEPGLFVAYISSDGFLYADNYYAGENCGSIFNLRHSTFSDAWNQAFDAERRIRMVDFTGCVDCPLAKASGYCDLQNMAMSQQLHGSSSHYFFSTKTSLCQSGYISIQRPEPL